MLLEAMTYLSVINVFVQKIFGYFVRRIRCLWKEPLMPALDSSLSCLQCMYIVFKEEHLLPLIYCLLSDKSAGTYVSVFGILQTEAVKANLIFQPQQFLSDYESRIIRDVAASFPNTSHHGCYFHFTQAIWHQVQTLGLTSQYRNDATVKSSVQQLMGLGFAKLPLICTVFMQLEAQVPAILQTVFSYFCTQWLTAVPPHMWNVHRLDQQHRTNNHLEGWHNGFNRLVTQHHPNIWQLLAALQQEQAGTNITIQQIAAVQVLNTVKWLWLLKVCDLFICILKYTKCVYFVKGRLFISCSYCLFIFGI